MTRADLGDELASRRNRKAPGHLRREAALDRIEAATKEAPGYNHGDPRYFAEMLASTLSCNPDDERIALACIENAVLRCALIQAEVITP